jgi:hypothetical protein
MSKQMIYFELNDMDETITIYINDEPIKKLQTLNYKDSINELIADLHNELLDLKLRGLGND